MALASLTSKAEGLERALNSLEMKRAGEIKQLSVAQKETELLRGQLRSAGRGGAGQGQQRGRGRAGGMVGASGLLR